MRFAGAGVVVIGGGGAIGGTICRRFAAEGAEVVVADRDPESAELVAAEAGGSWHRVDVTDGESVQALFTAVGGSRTSVDVLVNCPAHATDTPFDQVTERQFDDDLATTLRGPFLAVQAALPMLMRSANGPNVVSIGSVNGLAAFGNEAYSAAKAGLANLTRNLAVRYGRRGLRFNVVAPGTIRTPVWDRRLARDPTVLDSLSALYPLGRVGTPDDIASACLFLASAEAGWITGQTLVVDGGVTAGNTGFIETTFGPDYLG